MRASKGRSWVAEESASILPRSRHPWSINRSIDRWISRSFDPHLLVSQTQKKRKGKKILPRMAGFFVNPWLQKSCDRKTFWSKRIPDQKPRKDEFFQKKKLFFSPDFRTIFSSSRKNFLRLLLPRRCCCWWDSRTRKKAWDFLT